ncbi:agmatinase [Pseudomonas aeruginosa]
MSLLKQLFLAICLFLVVAFSGSFVSSVENSREQLRGQLRSHAQDAATALGLSLTPHVDDPAMVQLMVSSIFDSGYFASIRVIDIKSGKPLVERKNLHQPLGGNEMPRFGGIATMMRLPHVQSPAELDALDAAFVGVPLDIGTSLRSGTRFGPREIRAESVMIRPYNMATGAAPFDSLNVADIGDVAINTFNLLEAVRIIEQEYDRILGHGILPLTLGGDHTITLPILRAIKKKHGKVGLVHVDAHADVNDHMFGEKIAHGTTFRRAVEEDLLDCDRVVQIGLRAQGYTAEDFNWSRKQGFRVVQAEECWHKSLEPLMAEVREKVGGGPVYLSFDIDGIDPAWAPGTGTPEIGGLTTIQAMEIIRGCQGLDLIGCDLVEVSPPYDTTGNTSLLGANLLYEMLCVLPGVVRR